ncbi:UNVERIFIED_CONTAM: hypothetical protein PYX00_011100 [Menopon gallinae]|uniref:3-oxoacyl-[acyl-carrier-protein] reductase n=1 Tax=Menopon gallinae TaxID=328185 RepID=A0AAW2H5Y8_9NEOP
MFNLQNKVAVVTGASGGIGDAIVRLFHKQGAIVVPVSRSKQYAEKLIDELKERIIAVEPQDITTENGCDLLIKEIVSKADRLDILVNNAGITKDNLTIRMKANDFEEVIKVNLLAPFLLSKLSLMAMMKNKWGRVINISSVVGVSGNPGQANYSSAKGGLITLTKTLAKEFASRNITVNSISPGFIQTKMTDVLTEEQKNSILSAVPL